MWPSLTNQMVGNILQGCPKNALLHSDANLSFNRFFFIQLQEKARNLRIPKLSNLVQTSLRNWPLNVLDHVFLGHPVHSQVQTNLR